MLLLTGLRRLPGYAHDFLVYLWCALITPVACYGSQVFAYSPAEEQAAQAQELLLFRRLLGVGGRAPRDIVTTLMGVDSCTLEWRVRRLGHFLRLLCSPVGSFEHIALMQLKHLHHPWFIAVQEDLQTALPGVFLHHADSAQGPFLFSSGRFTADGFWLSAQPFAFPRDHLHRRRCLQTLTGIDASNLKAHVRNITGAFRIQLRRQEASALFDRIHHMRQTSEYSKVDLLFSKLCSPGPPLNIILTWSGTPMQQSAMSALFCGDLCLGRYAGNYFARSLCPCRPDDAQDAECIGVAPTRVCLNCWHYHRNLCLDDEFHVILCCPAFERARTKLFQSLSTETHRKISECPALQRLMVW